MGEKKRRKITPLGWTVGIALLIISIITLIFVWSPLTNLFQKMGIAPFLGGMISFFIIYLIFTAIMIAVIKLGEKRLFREVR